MPLNVLNRNENNCMNIVNIIGCGRVGKTIGKLLHHNKLAKIQDISNTTFESAQKAINFIGAGTACQRFNALRPADIYFITTPDNRVESVCEQLLNNHAPKSTAIFVQCSGILPAAQSMAAAKAIGLKVASVHPLKSFADPNSSVETFAGTYCALEGDSEALKQCETLLTALDAQIFKLNSKQKPLYHAACVIASNYAVTLHDIAEKTFTHAGIDKNTAGKIAHSLMQSTLNNLENLPKKEALTGPINRGEIETIQQHILALLNHPHLLSAYQALGINTLPLTPHSDHTKQSFLHELNKLSKKD